MAQYFNLQKQSTIHDKHTTWKNENEIIVTLSRNEIKCFADIYYALGAYLQNTQEKSCGGFYK
jgi:hypothetical protein